MRVGLSIILPGIPFCGGRGGAAATGLTGTFTPGGGGGGGSGHGSGVSGCSQAGFGKKQPPRQRESLGVATRSESEEEKMRSPDGSMAGN